MAKGLHESGSNAALGRGVMKYGCPFLSAGCYLDGPFEYPTTTAQAEEAARLHHALSALDLGKLSWGMSTAVQAGLGW